MFGNIVGPLLSVGSKLISGKSKGSSGSRQPAFDPRIGFVAEKTYAMRAAENAKRLSDPGRRMTAEQEGRTKEVAYKEEVMSLYRNAQANTRVREAIIQQAERQGNISPILKKARYDISDPLKRDTDTRTKPLKLET